MTDMVAEVEKAAGWVSTALEASGYLADFSPQSLHEIDRFFDDHSANGAARLGGLLAEQLGYRLFALGSYVGETIRRNVGGEWKYDPEDPEAEINIELHLSRGSVIWPVQRMMKRFKNGREDGIAGYGFGMGLAVGAPPAQKKKRGILGRLFGK